MKKYIEEFLYAVSSDDKGRNIGTSQPCKLCANTSYPFCAVDFNKSCNNYPLNTTALLVEYFKCAICDLIFTDFFDDWSEEDFRKFIYNGDYVLVDPDYLGSRATENARLFAEILKPAKGDISVLDYGGGQGGFALELQRQGFAQTRSYDPYGQNQELSNDTFDVVTAFEVIEHSTNPVQTLDQILSRVSPDGLAIIGQSMQPDDIDEIRDRWWYIAPRNGHVTFYSHQTLLQYAQSRAMIYRSVGGWFVLHRPTTSDSASRILEGLAAEIEFISIGAPPAQAGTLGEWNDVENDGNSFRWTACQEVPLGRHLFRSNRTAISIRYAMTIEADFVHNCALRIGCETFPLRVSSSGNLEAIIRLGKRAHYNVTLVTPPPKQPAALGLNPDSRELGIAIYCQAEP